MLSVQVVVRGITSGDEDYLAGIVDKLEQIGGSGVAVAYYPEDNEIGVMFDIEEEVLGGLLESGADRAAA